jgi:DNA topoisomerase VI subunit B
MSARHLKRRKKTKTGIPTGVAREMIEAIDGGIIGGPLLAEKFKFTKQRTSYLLSGLIKAGWLRKDGKNYGLTPKAKKSTAQAESSNAYESAPVKDSQTSKDGQKSDAQHGLNAKTEVFREQIQHDHNSREKGHFLHFDLEFERPDWSIYLTNLSQRAGVPNYQIRAVTLKELVDNALDEMDRCGRPGKVTLTQDGPHTFTVRDWGRGFPDTPEQLALRFSLQKGMISSKQWRRLTRGCVGNGLRVVVAAVTTGGGRIIVRTRDREITLRPLCDGTTDVEEKRDIDWSIGTAIAIEIDPAYGDGCADPKAWAETAIALAQAGGAPCKRKPSALWYDTDHLAMMLSSTDKTKTLNWFAAQLDRCSTRVLSQQITQRFGRNRLCRDMKVDEAAQFLKILQAGAPTPIRSALLGPLGREAWKHKGLLDGYACEEGFFLTGRHLPQANIPFLIEAWTATCQPTSTEPYESDEVSIIACTINRTPMLLRAFCDREGRSRNAQLSLGNTDIDLDLPRGAYMLSLNITSPVVELLGDNKIPHLNPFAEVVALAVQKAVRRASRNNSPLLCSGNGNSQHGGSKKKTIKNQIFDILLTGDVINQCNDNGILSFNQRSLYYVVRTFISGLSASYFAEQITEYENRYGEIPKLTRENRGVYYEPHSGVIVPLGTLSVLAYRRPPWLYSAVLITEKADNVQTLVDAGFPEEYDCLLLSSSGFTTRALKDMIDLIGSSASSEPVRIFAMVDADSWGSMIYQTLVQETKARGARNVEIINLGLFPWTAMAEGLRHESGLIEERRKKRKALRVPVAGYILERDRTNRRSGNPNGELEWAEWLQDNRIELNAMVSAKRVEWVKRGFDLHGVKKVIPPAALCAENLRASVENELRDRAKQAVLDDAQERIEAEVAQGLDTVEWPEDISAAIGKYLQSHSKEPWKKAICHVSEELCDAI